MGAASLGATPLSQAEQQAQAKDHATPCEGGVGDAGLRRASLSPHSKTLSRDSGTPDRQTSRTYDITPSLNAIHACHCLPLGGT